MMPPNGQMPPQGGAPQPQPQQPPQQGAGAPPNIQQLPPEIARHIDPNNKIQILLLQRIDKFTPQDGAAMQQLTPPQIAALKKVLPELAFLLDMIVQGQNPMQGQAMPPPGGGAPGGGAPMPPQQGAPGGGAPPPPAPRPPGAGLSRF